MHFYWKMIEELKLIGENWIMKDPGLSRCYHIWIERNQSAIWPETTRGIDPKRPSFNYRGMPHSLN